MIKSEKALKRLILDIKPLDEPLEVPFNTLIGLTISSITGGIGDESVIFNTTQGTSYEMMHHQDWCESVTVEDVCGNLNDLIGNPILIAREDTNSDENPEGIIAPEYQDSFTWTFYNLATIKGSVTIRWYGDSNGYYSETVEFYRIK